MLGFGNHHISGPTTQLCHCSRKAAMDKSSGWVSLRGKNSLRQDFSHGVRSLIYFNEKPLSNSKLVKINKTK